MQSGDVIVDGGNSYYKDSIRRSQGLAARSIGFIDVGTSGAGHFVKMVHNGIEPYVEDSGEGRWTIQAAISSRAK